MMRSRPERDKVMPWLICAVAVTGLIFWIIYLLSKLNI